MVKVRSVRPIYLPTSSGLHEEQRQVRTTLSAGAGDGACDGACAVRTIRLALGKIEISESKLVSQEKVFASLHPPLPQARRGERLQVRLTSEQLQLTACVPGLGFRV